MVLVVVSTFVQSNVLEDFVPSMFMVIVNGVVILCPQALWCLVGAQELGVAWLIHVVVIIKIALPSMMGAWLMAVLSELSIKHAVATVPYTNTSSV